MRQDGCADAIPSKPGPARRYCSESALGGTKGWAAVTRAAAFRSRRPAHAPVWPAVRPRSRARCRADGRGRGRGDLRPPPQAEDRLPPLGHAPLCRRAARPRASASTMSGSTTRPTPAAFRANSPRASRATAGPVVVTEPGEWRVWQMMQEWRRRPGASGADPRRRPLPLLPRRDSPPGRRRASRAGWSSSTARCAAAPAS